MKKVLVVTYYWPPAGGGGIQRIAKFCRYLPEFGWTPVVLTVSDGTYADHDASLEDDVGDVRHVYRARTWEPHAFMVRRHRSVPGKPVNGAPPGAGARALRRIADWVRLNVFIPDPRIGWYPGAVALGRRAIARHNPAAMLSSAPPYTGHLVARRLHRDTGLPWIADFRDPWLENHTYNTSPRLGLVKRINRRLEGTVLNEAEGVLCVGNHMRELLLTKPGLQDNRGKCRVITNGYDDQDRLGAPRASSRFFVSHFGRMYLRRFPLTAMETLAHRVQTQERFRRDFRLRVYGGADNDVRALLMRLFPSENVRIESYLPHREVLDRLGEDQLLLLSIDRVPGNELIVTGKIFEYLMSGNPVLGIGPPDGDAADILRETHAGEMYDYQDRDNMDAFVEKAYRQWRAGEIERGGKRFPIYERRQLAGRLAAILDGLPAATR